jgi:tripeptidyl-peptidase-1
VDYITPGIKLHAIPTRTKKKRERRAVGIVGKKPASPLLHNPGAVEEPSSESLATCDQYITPACVKALYQISDATKAAASNAMGIFEEGDFYDQADLTMFFQKYASKIPSGTHPTAQLIDGASGPGSQEDSGGESLLDFSLAYPIIYPQKIKLFQTDDDNYALNFDYGDGLFNTFLDAIDGSYCRYTAFGETGDAPIDPAYPDPNGYNGKLMCGVYKPTNVISLSYGVQEADLPANYQKRQCNEYMKLGLQGTSIFFASGDSGVAGRGGDGSENGCLGPSATVFNPPFPAT